MICYLCKEDKLSKEFPFTSLSENCDHPLLHCLECIVESVKEHGKCSQCDSVVNEDNETYKEYLETLTFLFPNEEDDVDVERDDSAPLFAGATSSNIIVTTLSGESATFSYSPNKKVLDLKKEVEGKLKTPSEKQRLLYKNTELKIKNQNHKLLTLKDYDVAPNSTLHLIILLCAVTEELDEVIFDFYWGYPRDGHQRVDYLDVSVFLYSGSEYLGVVDFRNPENRFCPGVTHSGPAKMDHIRRVGNQKVHVSIKSIPDYIDKLVFTLSAWRSPNISRYPNPRLHFYDARSPDKQLCCAEMSHAGHCEAIVMCSLSKKDGYWATYELRIGASGCTKNYRPLREKILNIIHLGYV